MTSECDRRGEVRAWVRCALCVPLHFLHCHMRISHFDTFRTRVNWSARSIVTMVSIFANVHSFVRTSERSRWCAHVASGERYIAHMFLHLRIPCHLDRERQRVGWWITRSFFTPKMIGCLWSVRCTGDARYIKLIWLARTLALHSNGNKCTYISLDRIFTLPQLIKNSNCFHFCVRNACPKMDSNGVCYARGTSFFARNLFSSLLQHSKSEIDDSIRPFAEHVCHFNSTNTIYLFVIQFYLASPIASGQIFAYTPLRSDL